MKIFKRVLLTLLITITTLVIAILIGLAWVVHNPRVVYNYVEKNYFPKDLKLHVTDHTYTVKYFGFTSLRFQLDLENLKASKTIPEMDLMFENIKLDLGLEFFKPKLTIYNFQTVSKTASKFHLPDAPVEEKNSETSLKTQIDQFKNYLALVHRYLVIDNILIAIDNLDFKPANQLPLNISALLTTPEKKIYQLKTDVKSENYTLGVVADLNGFEWVQDKEFLNLKVDFKHTSASLNTETSLKPKDGFFNVYTQGNATYLFAEKKIKIQPKLNLELSDSQVVADLDLNLDNLPGPVTRIRGIDAKLTVPITNEYAFKLEPSKLTINAPTEINFINAKTKSELETKCDCKFPQKAVVRLASNFLIPNVLSTSKDTLDIGFADIKVDSFTNEVFDIDFQTKTSISKINRLYDFKPNIDLQVLIKSFKRLAPIADYFGLMIPAPLDVLDGTIKLSSGTAEILEKSYKLPFNVDIDLKSKNQKIKLQDVTSVEMSKDFKNVRLHNNVIIDDMILELPELSPAGGIPRFGGDDRIFTDNRIKDALKKGEKVLEPSSKKNRTVNQAATTKLKFEMWTDVKTTKKNSIQLKSKYFKPHMPMNISFETTSDLENSGVIHIEPFNVVYLRRTARLEKMKLELNKKIPEKIFVDGQFTVQQSFYKVIIDVNGDSAAPNIVLSSEPELSRADIISVLLYDKTRDQLVPSDVETAGGVEAAFTVKALGLFSLWALASTPIRSFNYNPVTKVYTATLVLGDGLTAGIGSDWESAAQFELRKRLTKRWVLTGRWVSGTNNRRDRSELVLQWEARF